MHAKNLKTNFGNFDYYDISYFEEIGSSKINEIPYSIRVLFENALRNKHNGLVSEDDLKLIASWKPDNKINVEFPYMPGRVLLQDFTGVPVAVDLAAMRNAVSDIGKDPSIINPIVRTDMVIDHSVQVDYFNSKNALSLNIEREYERNSERYKLLKWAQNSFNNFRIVPPGTGIVHQVNLEYLGDVVLSEESNNSTLAYPDTCIGTDSHTTMINGLGVLAWGVGGIEAEAVMLGQPSYIILPEVVGVRITGDLNEGVTATDLVLSITEKLRKLGVVEKFVEFFGEGLSNLSLPDRATIANMSPEYGATCGFFPVDDQTLKYLDETGRSKEQISLVEYYSKENYLFHDEKNTPKYSQILDFDLGNVVASLSGPKRPQDRIALSDVKENFETNFPDSMLREYKVEIDSTDYSISDGSIVIAAITSCTNTSNPSVMIGAGILAKNAILSGLRRKPWVKTSLAPGSTVVTKYLESSGLDTYLEELGFNTVGYGCTTCIGNSGPLPENISEVIDDNNLIVAAVLSGNRNFEGRVHSQVKANYLGSPMLVIAYALFGRIDVDIVNDSIGVNDKGEEILLKDIWPTSKEITDTLNSSLNSNMFKEQYSNVYLGTNKWRELKSTDKDLFSWDLDSSYIQKPPYFNNFELLPKSRSEIKNARVLAHLGDSVTTDHISPAGSIPFDAPSGKFLISNEVLQREFNSYGSRRGNHEIMVRGTFGNIRLRNLLTPDDEGDWTIYIPNRKKMRIYEASQEYIKNNIPTIIIAGKEYGTGSSRDWAAKGPALLGVRVVIAESFERIHRSNLIGMGIIPCEFMDGENFQTLGLTGYEEYEISDLEGKISPGSKKTVIVKNEQSELKKFEVILRIDTEIESDYYEHGGLLPYVLRQMISEDQGVH